MSMLSVVWRLGMSAAFAAAARAVPEVSLPPYHPEIAITGEVRIWGSPTDGDLLQGWSEGFQHFHPAARVVLALHGPESAMMGVYTGVAEVALMARELRIPAETMAFTWAWRYAPSTIEVANAGPGPTRPNGPIRVWCNEANPLAGLTLAQLDALYGAETKRGGTPAQTWGDLGLTGAQAGRPIHRYGPPIDSVAGLFFRHAVLQDSYKWNPEVKELASDAAVLAAVAADPDAIGYGAQPPGPAPAVRTLGLAAKAGAPWVMLTAESAADRSYPLARVAVVVINRKPDSAIEPRTREFLRYVLSADGQAVVATRGGCLPLTAAQLAAQRENLQ